MTQRVFEFEYRRCEIWAKVQAPTLEEAKEKLQRGDVLEVRVEFSLIHPDMWVLVDEED